MIKRRSLADLNLLPNMGVTSWRWRQVWWRPKPTPKANIWSCKFMGCTRGGSTCLCSLCTA